MTNYKYKVCIRCITYNHGPYITAAMDGFTHQQTSFPYVATIIDDASTDGEQVVIRKYLDNHFDIDNASNSYFKETDYANIFYARHKTNTNCYFVVLFLKENHYRLNKGYLKMIYVSEWFNGSQYEAFCEGDDIWVNPNKLQMQVDFMDKHPDYSVCHTNYEIVGGSKIYHHFDEIEGDNYFPYSVEHELQVVTATALYRHEAYQKIPKLWKGKDWQMGDTPLWIELSKEGRIKYLSEITAAYRVLASSASHGNKEKELSFINNAIEIHQFYANYYGVDLINNGYDGLYYLSIGKIAYKHFDKVLARSNIKAAYNNNCISFKLIVLYFMTCLSPIRWLAISVLKYQP